MKLRVLISILLCSFIFSCSSDSDDSTTPNTNTPADTGTDTDVMQQEMTPEEMQEQEGTTEVTNTAPSASNQSFVLSQVSINTLVGTVQASDTEQTNLTFRIQQINVPFNINNSGEIRITNTVDRNYSLTVIISDGSLTTSINVTITIPQMEGPMMLTADQIAMIDFFKFSVFNETSSSPTTTNVLKWNSEIKVFLSGSVTNADTVFTNNFFTDLKNISGNINIRLVNTLDEANIEVFFASPQDYINNRPDYINGFTPSRGVVGFASFGFFNNLIQIADIWVDSTASNKNAIIKHEILHALGFDHTEEDQSIFYFAPSASMLSLNDVFTIKTLYNSLIRPGFTRAQIDTVINDNIDVFFN